MSRVYLLLGLVTLLTTRVIAQAQTPLSFTWTPPAEVVIGQSYEISWTGGDGSSVTISLQEVDDDGDDFDVAAILCSGCTGTSFTWTPTSAVTQGGNNVLAIEQGVTDGEDIDNDDIVPVITGFFPIVTVATVQTTSASAGSSAPPNPATTASGANTLATGVTSGSPAIETQTGGSSDNPTDASAATSGTTNPTASGAQASQSATETGSTGPQTDDSTGGGGGLSGGAIAGIVIGVIIGVVVLLVLCVYPIWRNRRQKPQTNSGADEEKYVDRPDTKNASRVIPSSFSEAGGLGGVPVGSELSGGADTQTYRTMGSQFSDSTVPNSTMSPGSELGAGLVANRHEVSGQSVDTPFEKFGHEIRHPDGPHELPGSPGAVPNRTSVVSSPDTQFGGLSSRGVSSPSETSHGRLPTS